MLTTLNNDFKFPGKKNRVRFSLDACSSFSDIFRWSFDQV